MNFMGFMKNLIRDKHGFWQIAGPIIASAAGALLGGGDGGGTSQVDKLTPEQKQAMAGLAAYLNPKIGTGVAGYPGQLNASQNEYETAGLAALMKLAGGVDPAQTEAEYNKYILPGQQRILNESILPKILESYAGPSGGTVWSSQRAKEQSRATQSWGETQGKTLYDMIMQNKTMAATAAPQLAQAGLLAQQMEQEQLTNSMNEWKRQQPEYSPYIDMALKMLGVSASDTVVQQSASNPLASMLGMLGVSSLMGGGNESAAPASSPNVIQTGNAGSSGVGTTGWKFTPDYNT
jgi:hypothetical protein